jgi:3-isopropylmalate/(R)-2-methylmalate dehydratase small subunit
MSVVIVKEAKGSGIAVRGNDIDTDRIIPARFLKCVTFDGIGEHAFADDIKGLAVKGEVHPFANETYANAGVLVSNKNFGCGSSREHAPQSLMRWGIKGIVAESYSEIFYGNCVALGVPAFTASHEDCVKMQDFIEANPTSEIVLDVATKTASFGGESVDLTITEGAKGQFLDGSWNARAQLVANIEKVKATAADLPYVGGF